MQLQGYCDWKKWFNIFVDQIIKEKCVMLISLIIDIGNVNFVPMGLRE
jgi:hypothetical protein